MCVGLSSTDSALHRTRQEKLAAEKEAERARVEQKRAAERAEEAAIAQASARFAFESSRWNHLFLLLVNTTCNS
jgi:uncharacterized membrane-anchored protein